MEDKTPAGRCRAIVKFAATEYCFRPVRCTANADSLVACSHEAFPYSNLEVCVADFAKLSKLSRLERHAITRQSVSFSVPVSLKTLRPGFQSCQVQDRACAVTATFPNTCSEQLSLLTQETRGFEGFRYIPQTHAGFQTLSQVSRGMSPLYTNLHTVFISLQQQCAYCRSMLLCTLQGMMARHYHRSH